MTAILTGVKENLKTVLICVSFMGKDDEHFSHVFIGHLHVFENCLFRSFAELLIGLFVLLVFTFCLSLPYIFFIYAGY
jgi:hypothetical protein